MSNPAPDNAVRIAGWLAEGLVVRGAVMPQLFRLFPQATLAEVQRGLLIADEIGRMTGWVRS